MAILVLSPPPANTGFCFAQAKYFAGCFSLPGNFLVQGMVHPIGFFRALVRAAAAKPALVREHPEQLEDIRKMREEKSEWPMGRILATKETWLIIFEWDLIYVAIRVTPDKAGSLVVSWR